MKLPRKEKKERTQKKIEKLHDEFLMIFHEGALKNLKILEGRDMLTLHASKLITENPQEKSLIMTALNMAVQHIKIILEDVEADQK